MSSSIANFLWPFEQKINSPISLSYIINSIRFFSRAHNNCEEALTAFFTLCFEPIERQKLNKKNRLHCTVHIFCFLLILEFFFIFFSAFIIIIISSSYYFSAVLFYFLREEEERIFFLCPNALLYQSSILFLFFHSISLAI